MAVNFDLVSENANMLISNLRRLGIPLQKIKREVAKIMRFLNGLIDIESAILLYRNEVAFEKSKTDTIAFGRLGYLIKEKIDDSTLLKSIKENLSEGIAQFFMDLKELNKIDNIKPLLSEFILNTQYYRKKRITNLDINGSLFHIAEKISSFEIPKSIKNLKDLNYLAINFINPIIILPSELNDLQITTIKMRDCGEIKFNADLELKSVYKIFFNHILHNEFDHFISKKILPNLKYLTYIHSDLNIVPKWIWEEPIEYIDLAVNYLTNIGHDIILNPSIAFINLSYNRIEGFPFNLAVPHQTIKLIFDHNALTSLPFFYFWQLDLQNVDLFKWFDVSLHNQLIALYMKIRPVSPISDEPEKFDLLNNFLDHKIKSNSNQSLPLFHPLSFDDYTILVFMFMFDTDTWIMDMEEGINKILRTVESSELYYTEIMFLYRIFNRFLHNTKFVHYFIEKYHSYPKIVSFFNELGVISMNGATIKNINLLL